jgi:ABC-2 type transport system permease protein
MAYAAMHAGINLNVQNYIWFAFLAIVSIILYYFLSVITIIPAFWATRISAINDLMNRMVQFMKYPAGVFPRFLRLGLSVAFPVILISYLPAKTFFYSPETGYIIYMIIITIVFGFITRFLWHLGEKNYGSASS